MSRVSRKIPPRYRAAIAAAIAEDQAFFANNPLEAHRSRPLVDWELGVAPDPDVAGKLITIDREDIDDYQVKPVVIEPLIESLAAKPTYNRSLLAEAPITDADMRHNLELVHQDARKRSPA